MYRRSKPIFSVVLQNGLQARCFQSSVSGRNTRMITTPSKCSTIQPQRFSPWIPSTCLARFNSSSLSVSEEKTDPEAKVSRSLRQEVSILLQNIDRSIQRTSRVNALDVRKLHAWLKEADSMRPNEALTLLRSCGEYLVDESPIKRRELALDFWHTVEQKCDSLDASHYNALLKAHVDNGHGVSPTEFLSWMEGKGIEANRVTFQHMIEKYCQEGELASATKILEHMKEKNMTINEQVFHSLIIGHCLARDFESARSVMDILSQSGIDAGCETKVVYLMGLIKGNEDWESVEKVMGEFENEGRFDDAHIFKLMVELVKIGQAETAVKLAEKLPKKSGYFQKMRNIIPQLAYNGGESVALELLSSSHFPSGRRDGHVDRDSRDNGVFFIRTLVKMEIPPEKMIDIIKRFQENNINKHAVTKVLEACVDLHKTKYGITLFKAIKAEFGEDAIERKGNLESLTRALLPTLSNDEEVYDLAKRMMKVGLRLSPQSLLLMMKRVLCPEINPMAAIKGIGEPFALVSNCAVQYYLNEENKIAFNQAASFLLNVDVPVRPQMWNASLARSFIITEDLDALISIILATRSSLGKADEANRKDKETQLLMTLNHIWMMSHRYNADPKEKLEQVLKTMKSNKIGIPEECAALLKLNAKDETISSLLEELVTLNETPMNSEDYLKLLEKRKKLHRMNNNSNRSHEFIPISKTGWVQEENIPSDLQGLKRLRSVLINRNQTNAKVTNSLICAELEGGNLDSALELYGEVQRNELNVYASTHHVFVNYYLGKADVDAAVQHIQDVMKSEKFQMFGRTLADICAYYLRQDCDNFGKVLELLRSADKDKIIGKELKQFFNLVSLDKMEELFAVLKENDLIGRSSGNYAPFVETLVAADKLDEAIGMFEKISREESLVPAKFLLTEKLIQAENMEGMQRVLDASIAAIGEERSLYDLAHVFLHLGRISQARKLLDTPGLRFNPDRCIWICKTFTNDGNIEALENFVKLTRNIFSCDRGLMYNQLINALLGNVENAGDKMMDVFLEMQSEGYPPSNQMKQKMARCFERHGKTVPFELPANTKTQSKPVDDVAENDEKSSLSTKQASSADQS